MDLQSLIPESGESDFHIHLVSDSTGETLEAIVNAALVQFEGVRVRKHNWPLIRSALQMNRLMEDISEDPGLVLYTLVNPDIRETLETACRENNMPILAILDPVINLLGNFFGQQAAQLPGRQHIMDGQYFDRIDALHFTVAHDDGQLAEDIPEADIILVGVSRTSKTPTSIYLANKGYKTLNVPFVPGVIMPPELDTAKDSFVIGLTTSPDRLVQIRTNRLRTVGEQRDTSYADMDQVKDEISACRRYLSERNWPVIDVTRRSIEETAAAIITRFNQWREEREDAAEKEA